MRKLAEHICARLAGGRAVAVATIISREGSAPRTAGSKMVVDNDGRFVGTIGGGRFEADVLSAAVDALASGRPGRMAFDLTRNDVDAMDMICGGKMEVLVDVVAPAGDTAAVFDAWRAAITHAAAASLVTVVPQDAAAGTTHCLVSGDGSTVGTWPLSPDLLTRIARRTGKPGTRLLSEEGADLLVEATASPGTLFIFGAGHVSQPTARMAADVGFRVVVADDRAAFANRDRFPFADEVLVLDDFETALSGLTLEADSFVVIVTRGHRYDKTVLAQALATPARYVGMIGSRSKRDAIYAALRAEGAGDADIARVHSPIGLSIGAETPEEIAVSIVAELIACRAGTMP